MYDKITNEIYKRITYHLEDIGIGVYEYWGFRGVDKLIVPIIREESMEIEFDLEYCSKHSSLKEIQDDLPETISFLYYYKDEKDVERPLNIQAELEVSFIDEEKRKVIATYSWGEE